MKWIKRLLSLCLICALLITNVITVASATLGSALSGIVGAVLGRKVSPAISPPRLRAELDAQKAENKLLNDRLNKHRTSVARVGNNAAKRTKRLALYNITESTLGALPIGGIAILVTGVGWEFSQLCDGMKEIDELYTELEIEDEMDSSVMDFVCHPSLLGQDGEQLEQISE